MPRPAEVGAVEAHEVNLELALAHMPPQAAPEVPPDKVRRVQETLLPEAGGVLKRSQARELAVPLLGIHGKHVDEWLRRLPQKGPLVTSSLKLMCSLPGVPEKTHDTILRR